MCNIIKIGYYDAISFNSILDQNNDHDIKLKQISPFPVSTNVTKFLQNGQKYLVIFDKEQVYYMFLDWKQDTEIVLNIENFPYKNVQNSLTIIYTDENNGKIIQAAEDFNFNNNERFLSNLQNPKEIILLDKKFKSKSILKFNKPIIIVKNEIWEMDDDIYEYLQKCLIYKRQSEEINLPPSKNKYLYINTQEKFLHHIKTTIGNDVNNPGYLSVCGKIVLEAWIPNSYKKIKHSSPDAEFDNEFRCIKIETPENTTYFSPSNIYTKLLIL